MQIRKLYIVLGDYGTGKTTFAKTFAKNNNGEYLDFEVLYFGDDNTPDDRFDQFIQKLRSTMMQSKRRNFVMDGYQVPIDFGSNIIDPTFSYLRAELGCEIQLCLCFAAPHIVHKRQLIKVDHKLLANPHNENEIQQVTEYLFSVVGTDKSEPILVDTTTEINLVPNKNGFQRWRELKFVSDLDKMQHDKYYQDIELPSGLKIAGYSGSNETWERLNSLVDFTNKDILDIGCFHGFFSFKCENAGAAKVTGIDINKDALHVSRWIAWLCNSKVRFYQGSIDAFNPECKYDIILVLNMLHHAKDPNKALLGVFNACNIVILELQEVQQDLATHIAGQTGFSLINKMNSQRQGREILIFSNGIDKLASLNKIPSRYEYDYRGQIVTKSFKSTLGRLLAWKTIQPFLNVLRKYRNSRGKPPLSNIKYS